MMKCRLSLVLLCFLLSSCASTGWRLKGDEFPKNYQQNLPDDSKLSVQEPLALRGVGVKTLFMIRVFIASFYLPSSVASSDALETDIPKHLSVVFYSNFSANDFFKFTRDHMKPNLTAQEFESLQEQLVQMKTMLPDIKKSDTFALSYNPSEGTSFILNSQRVGVIRGKLFSKAIFSTWIGPYPFDHIVKRNILNIK